MGRVKEKATVPVFVGFGISKQEHVRKIGAFSDGVVVGSALVATTVPHERRVADLIHVDEHLVRN